MEEKARYYKTPKDCTQQNYILEKSVWKRFKMLCLDEGKPARQKVVELIKKEVKQKGF